MSEPTYYQVQQHQDLDNSGELMWLQPERRGPYQGMAAEAFQHLWNRRKTAHRARIPGGMEIDAQHSDVITNEFPEMAKARIRITYELLDGTLFDQCGANR